MNSRIRWSRRELVGAAALAALTGSAEAGGADDASQVEPSDRWRGLKAGVASYTLRKFSLDMAIKDVQRVGLRYVSIKDAHCPLTSTQSERHAVAQAFKDAGITPLSCGNVTMAGDEASIRNVFEYARDLGLPTIVCSPDPGSLGILDKMVAEFDVRIAIHNHGPGDRRFPTPSEVWSAVQGHDRRVGLCIDVGHTGRSGVDPAQAVLKYRERLYDLHFKDINAMRATGTTVEGGRGVLDMRAILKALQEIRYNGLLSFEYEKDPDDPLPGLSETIGYSKGLIRSI